MTDFNDEFDILHETEEKTEKKKGVTLRISAIILCVLLTLSGFIGGYYVGAGSGMKVSEEEYELIGRYEILQTMMDYVNSNFYLEVTEEQQIFNACVGIIGNLDKYSGVYVDTGVEYTSTYYGITVNSEIPGKFRVTGVDKGSPADNASHKIDIGDYIVSVQCAGEESVTVDGRYLSVLTELMTGKVIGEEITVVFAEEYDEVSHEYASPYTVTMAAAERSSYTYVEYIGDFSEIDPSFAISDDIGYIMLTEFNSESAEQFVEAVGKFASDGKKYLILDLRDNPGGSGDSMSEIASYLITDGTDSDDVTVITHEYKDGTSFDYKNRRNNYIYKSLPVSERPKIAVLLNGASASASEALTGAMIVAGTCELFGETSYGKGIGQSTSDFSFGERMSFSVTLSIGYYYFAGDVSEYVAGSDGEVYNIHGLGFTPKGEYYVKKEPSSILTEDNQFLAAVDYFSN